MKKPFIAFMIAVLMVLSFGCSKKSEKPAKQDASDKQTTVSQQDNSGTNAANEPKLPVSNVYENIECGYSFEFPVSWQGYYFVNDENPQVATVRFYGKSIAGTTYEKDTFGGDWGLTMFFIISHEEMQKGFYDSVTKLGTARGSDYYFATTTDVSIAPLIDKGAFGDMTEDEEEKWNNDNKKLMEMVEFYSYENRENLKKAWTLYSPGL